MKHLDKIKAKLEAGQPVIGTHIKSTEPAIGEVFGHVGFDFVWIDAEHPIMTIETAMRHTIAAQGMGMAVFYRLPWNDPVLVKPILDMGVDGIVFPMICTAEDAQRAVSACRYPPRGIRGWGPVRDSGYGTRSSEWQIQNAENLWKIMQIEHYQAVDNLEEIMAVDGVDAITVGASDLSCSMGMPMQVDHPDVMAKLDEIARKAKAAGMPFSISMGYHPVRLEQWIRRGITWLSISDEFDFLTRASREILALSKAEFEKSRCDTNFTETAAVY